MNQIPDGVMGGLIPEQCVQNLLQRRIGRFYPADYKQSVRIKVPAANGRI
ncbi:hypothetical protein ACWX0K_18535 [Nitrobacteraceae bacterium UC4446_H13]|jgi:hypothetical protein